MQKFFLRGGGKWSCHILPKIPPELLTVSEMGGPQITGKRLAPKAAGKKRMEKEKRDKEMERLLWTDKVVAA